MNVNNNRQLMLNILLHELGGVDNFVEPIVAHVLKNYEIETDVYVNNYFEEVVPKYSQQKFKSHFRMTRNTISNITEDIRQVFVENNVNVNNMAVSLEKKVHVTIWMLANYAVTFKECGTLFGLSAGSVHCIFMQICTAVSLLRRRVIQWPTVESCNKTANAIQERHNFPGVIGALDGCHIEIKAPHGIKYDYFKRKQFYSVILQGTCEPSLKFIDIFVGMPGRMHDARVYQLSPLSNYISQGLIPQNFHILADSAYSPQLNVLTPVRDNGRLTKAQVKYNTKHAIIRSMIERSFWLLKNKFRRLRFVDMNLVEEIPIVVTACCVLHNLIINYEGFEAGENEVDDIEQEWAPLQNHRVLVAGQIKRNQIIDQF